MFKKLKAILFAKCPNCYKGNLFLDSNPYHIKNMDKMHKNCPNCNLDYSNETGFYWLSMYTGYFLSGVLSVVFFSNLYFHLWIFKQSWHFCYFKYYFNVSAYSNDFQMV